MSKSVVLVTGGAGFIGSAVADTLIRAGHQVVIVDNFSTGNRSALPKGSEFSQLSITDSKALSQLMIEKKVEAVFHFAAFVKVGESVEQPEKYFKNNSDGTLALLDAMAAAQVKKLIFSSTAAVYGQVKVLLVAETHPLEPMNPYGASKLQAENLIQNFASSHSDFRFLIYRYFNVAGSLIDHNIGPWDPHPTQLIRRACQSALNIPPKLEVFGDDYPTSDGTCIRDYIHVKDLALAHLRGLELLQKKDVHEILNIGYGSGYSVKEVITALEKITGQPVPHIMRPRRAGDPTAVVADASKAIRLLDLKWAHNNIEEICRDSLLWEKSLKDRMAKEV